MNNVEQSSYFTRSETLDQPLDDQRVARAGQRVHGHAPASESHTLLVEFPLVGVRRCTRVPAEHRLAHEIREVQRVAYMRHPAEQIRQADLAKTARHVNDGQQVFLQGRLVRVCLTLDIVEAVIDVAAFGNWFFRIVGGLRLKRTEDGFLD